MVTTHNNQLVIQNLHVSVAGKAILRGADLEVVPGKVVALMGPNGSGKSTLAQVLMGNPMYEVTQGSVLWQGKNILELAVHERAQLGLFLSFQYPHELPGVNMYEFLSTSYKALRGLDDFEQHFEQRLASALEHFNLNKTFLERNVNEGFSGGEKKKSEMLQLELFQPKIAIMDETDSGLDIDALKLIASNISAVQSPDNGFLVITHYQRLLTLLEPDEVHVLIAGKIVKSGDKELVTELEQKGYEWLSA